MQEFISLFKQSLTPKLLLFNIVTSLIVFILAMVLLGVMVVGQIISAFLGSLGIFVLGFVSLIGLLLFLLLDGFGYAVFIAAADSLLSKHKIPFKDTYSIGLSRTVKFFLLHLLFTVLYLIIPGIIFSIALIIAGMLAIANPAFALVGTLLIIGVALLWALAVFISLPSILLTYGIAFHEHLSILGSFEKARSIGFHRFSETIGYVISSFLPWALVWFFIKSIEFILIAVTIYFTVSSFTLTPEGPLTLFEGSLGVAAIFGLSVLFNLFIKGLWSFGYCGLATNALYDAFGGSS